MNTRTRIIVGVIALLVAFACGRFLSSERVRTEVKTVEVEKIVVKTEHVVTTIREKPDGSKDTTIVSDTDSKTKTDSSSTDNIKEVTLSKSTLNISALVGIQLPMSNNSLIYGLSATKSIIGPITAGVFVLNNASGGLSIGLNL